MIRIDMIENLIHSLSLVSVFYTNMFTVRETFA